MRKLFSLVLAIIPMLVSGQEWLDLLENGSDFQDIRNAANDYFAKNQGKDLPGYKHFKRWEYQVEKRLGPNGEWPEQGHIGKALQDLKNNSTNLRQANFPVWNSKGPSNNLNLAGLGRLNFVKFHPNDTSIIYVGSPSGGLWKSYDDGVTFEVLNDTLPAIGCADLLFDPQNDSVLYLGTGDRVGTSYSTNSDGIWKSTDAGYSWQQTGLTFSVNQNRKIGRMAINSLNPKVMFAAVFGGSGGVYKTSDGGDNWTVVQSGNFNDIRYMPGDTSIIYASGSTYLRSEDGGNNWNQVFIASGIRKFEMAVTPANPSKLLIVGCKSSDSGLDGIYQSLDSGKTFSTIHPSTPNILGYAVDGSSPGGISWYCMAIDISPIDEDLVFVGGVNCWKSTDGGSTFNISSYYINDPISTGVEYAHADCHYLTFSSSGKTVYAGNDGGIYRSQDYGDTWDDISATLVITQSYRLGLGQQSPDFYMMGNQDNGTNLNDQTIGYRRVLGADGMECIIGHTDANNMWGSYQNGVVLRSTNGGGNFSWNIDPGSYVNENSQWVTTFVMDPFQEEVLFVGYSNIYKTTNSGNSWFKVNNTSFPSGGSVSSMDISKWNPDKLLATKGFHIYVSEDGGISWERITGGGITQGITYAKFDNTDFSGNTIYVTYGGYSISNKLYKTTDKGATWINESDGLPNVSTECVMIDDEGGSGGVYVGNEIGVYYKGDTMNSFVPYMNGLPNVIVTEMDIHYASKKITAVTYGRGVWEVDLLITGTESYTKSGGLEMLVWPNPAQGMVNIRMQGSRSDGNISIYDNTGMLISTRDFEQGQLESEISIDLKDWGLTAGLYFIKLKSGDQEISEKLIIN